MTWASRLGEKCNNTHPFSYLVPASSSVLSTEVKLISDKQEVGSVLKLLVQNQVLVTAWLH